MDSIFKGYIFNIEGALRNHWNQQGKNVDGHNRVLRAVVMEVDSCMFMIK